MPILPAEPDMYPPDLWQGEVGGLNQDARWWCLRTRPRQEKATARHLHSRGITYYLPQIAQQSRTPAGRKIQSVLPLFPNYLFCQGDDYQRVEALKGNTLVQTLEVVDQQRIIDELRQIHQVLKSGLPVVREPTYPVGSRVRIKTGPLTGVTGTVVRRDQGPRFVAIVSFLSCGASVDLEDWQVEPVPA